MDYIELLIESICGGDGGPVALAVFKTVCAALARRVGSTPIRLRHENTLA